MSEREVMDEILMGWFLVSAGAGAIVAGAIVARHILSGLGVVLLLAGLGLIVSGAFG